jgi:hypothetical protein
MGDALCDAASTADSHGKGLAEAVAQWSYGHPHSKRPRLARALDQHCRENINLFIHMD